MSAFFKKLLKNKGETQRNCDIFIVKRSLSKSERAANFLLVFLLISAIRKWINLGIVPKFIKRLSIKDK